MSAETRWKLPDWHQRPVRWKAQGAPIDVSGTGAKRKTRRKDDHGGSCNKPSNLAEARAAIRIDWMTRYEISQAIPPAYSEYLGKYMIVAALAGKRERMDIEQKAIKAVANVAAQAYRRAFDVKPDMTTGALAVMADAIAALDQPTLAPKIDKEDAIWRAIGSLAQRVRDLEQPTAPEPPKASGPDHNCPDNCVSESSKCPAVGWFQADNLLPMCPNYTPPKTECSNQPEASQPLSAAVEAAVNDFENRLKSETYAITMAFLKPDLKNLRSRLASLWPKAGQVDEVTEAKLVEKWMQKNGWEWPVAGADNSDYDEAVRTVKWFMAHIKAGR